MDVMTRLLANMQRIWRQMSNLQRMSIWMAGLAVAASLGVMVFIGSTGKDTTTIPLPPRVPAEQWEEYKALLEEKGVKAQYDLESERIIIPNEQRNEAMLVLAGNKLLGKDAYVGFAEMIEKVSYSTTNEHRKTMMLTARQNELQRMIAAIDGIESATVILSTNEDKLVFGRQRIRPRASVKVSMGLGKQLTQDVADTIIQLVAASTQELDADAVVVVDQNGQHFRSQDGNSVAARARTRDEMQETQSRKIQGKVEELCRAFLPGVEAFAFVDLSLDMDERETEKYDILPGQPLRERTDKMTRESTQRPAEVTGVTPNQVRSANLGGGGGQQTRDVMSRKQSDVTNENGRLIERHKYAPGDRKRMSVSVVLQLPYEYEVDEKTKEPVRDAAGQPKRKSIAALTEAQQARLLTSIKNSAGLETIRDIEISQVEWRPPLDGIAAPATAGDKLLAFAEKHAVVLIMTALVGMVLIMLWGQIVRALPAEEIMPELQASLARAQEGEEGEADPNNNFEILREKVADIIAEDPKKAASVLRRWMVSE